MRMAPTGDADHWQRFVRIMLGLAVDLGGGNGAAYDRVLFVLSPAWHNAHYLQRLDGGGPVVIPSEWRVRLDIRTLVLSEPGKQDAMPVAESVDDMRRVVEWTKQVAEHWRVAEDDRVQDVPRSPPAPPDPTTWAGLHILVLWRQLWAVCGKDPRLTVSVERHEDGGDVVVVGADVECHLVR
ncbi:hypothetical protein BCR44DRAFT_1436308 [Catenaria anguillulae PL171]|uniref:Uncharacterized protein n=1 Tax=Catenaria anguillulae PL171 TaxID=765915 RepID=A0A1Y2HKW8_9FUNG|nr:hypothetical protein BCR44DRAFT_1436308 [Catenaria anguillulae PL171]